MQEEKRGTDVMMSILLSHYEPHYTTETTPGIPCEYLAIEEAWSGVSAHVYFCVSKSFVASTKTIGFKEANLSELTNFVQAVKLSKVRNHGWIAHEVAVLKSIQQRKEELERDLPFFELLAWDTDGPVPRWLATSTLPLCCDLTTLRQHLINEQVLPKTSVWLLFVQLYEALDFLYRICDPPIEHSDFHEGNVIVGYTGPHLNSLPEIKVIDFGLAGPDFRQSPLSEEDAMGVVAILYNLLRSTSPSDKVEDMKTGPTLDPSADKDSVVFHEFKMEIPSMFKVDKFVPLL